MPERRSRAKPASSTARPAKRVKAARKATPRAAAEPKPTPPSTAVPRFFARPEQWRAWLAKHHTVHHELWVGFWRVDSGKPSITWPQSVDQALCFGWIDGLRKSLDGESYMIRFTPRKPGSLWSRVNLKRFEELLAAGAVHTAGREARAKWNDDAKAGYSHETGRVELDRAALAKFKANARAWKFLQAQTPSYRKMVQGWAMNPKREATRAARLETLIECCAAGPAIPPLVKWVKVKTVP